MSPRRTLRTDARIAARKAREWTLQRDRCVVALDREEGLSLREIGAIVDLSHTAVRQILARDRG